LKHITILISNLSNKVNDILQYVSYVLKTNNRVYPTFMSILFP
uniref:IS4 family transposase n=1 Tax=Strongyloides papillosus TaxID=174720 RepID=A0A0N5BK67_STREA